ncbi:MAG: hypothetical protein AAF321_07865 [Pseudomonadota bacterium]
MTATAGHSVEAFSTAERWMLRLALFMALGGVGFASAWWIDNGAAVYVSRLATGFILCL